VLARAAYDDRPPAEQGLDRLAGGSLRAARRNLWIGSGHDGSLPERKNQLKARLRANRACANLPPMLEQTKNTGKTLAEGASGKPDPAI
jgi:hypothetical protein